ncbi:MAG: NADH-quinone oxidoreductase subunit L [Acidimicrobiales bacterium]|jgi:NADH-quinone oxidoreductase subunit L|nr:NADH-quinone oxidoreductase subunit L [Actinomycetota bacterium]
MLHAAYLMVLLPAAGFVLLLAFGRRLGDPWAGWLGTAAVAGSFVATCITYAGLLGRPAGPSREVTQTYFTWIAAGSFHVKAGLLVDPLSMTMALFVSGVSMLIHLYSIGYMKRDGDYPKFFVYMNLFVASMMLLVLGSSLIVTFVGWEGVGLCSYFLIAYWFERPAAASAGKKAFVYNRIGDAGFLLAMFLLFDKTGTLGYRGIFAHAHGLSTGVTTAAVLLLFLAATGKSAQIPLFPWLPDAMEGPTPVSALIHAATMVTSGVYLLCRMSPLLAHAHDAALVIAAVGAATAFVGATIACAQNDIKKVVAFSTVSQLGYMFLAVGTGAYEAAIFLMVAHAFYKGLLFLGSGSVIHGLHDEQDLKRMGGLARYMPLTALTFASGWFALAGVPPLSGFWAKGDVLDNAFAKFPALWVVGAVTAALTAYYSSRLFILAFTGDERWRRFRAQLAPDHAGSAGAGAGDSHAGEPHEAPFTMAVPLVLLGIAAFAGGMLSLPWHTGITRPLAWLGPVFGANLYAPHQSVGLRWALGVVDSVLAFGGIGAAWAIWRTTSERPRLEPVFLRRVWFVNELYDAVIGRPGERVAAFASAVVDRKAIDGVVEGLGRATRLLGSSARRVQTGYLRQYALGLAIGLVALLAFMLTRAWP